MNKCIRKNVKKWFSVTMTGATLLSSLLMGALPARAAVNVAWGADGTAFASNPSDEQALPQAYQNTFHHNPLSRDNGFTFVGWRDARDAGVHVQKLDADGIGQWGSAGVTIDGSTFNAFNIITQPDGAGGVYVIWEQGSNINVLRLDDDGSVHSGWATTGTAASTNYFDTQGAVLDGAGGIIVIYDVFGGHVRGTRVLPDGSTDWSNQLILDASDYCTIDVGHAVSDGTGGVFIGWYGYLCSDFIARYHLLRLDDDGSVSSGWSATGETIDGWSVFDESSRSFDLTADGSGGVIITWTSFHSGFGLNGRDIKAQRYNASGSELWTSGGVGVAVGDTIQQDMPNVATDGSGEAVISFRVDEDHINAQRLNSSGVAQWTAGGVTILDNTQFMRGVPVTDGAGGLIVAWEPSGSVNDLYVQRWSSSASKLWGTSGTQASSIVAGSQPFTRLLSNEANGVVMVFESNDSPTQIIAQQVCEDTCPPSVGGGGGSNDPTLSNAITMSRLKISTSSAVTISFALQNQLDGTWTATFPAGFIVTGAMTSGTCSGGGTIDTFAFDGPSRTMTAEKHACSGTLTLSGGTVTNPGTPGIYHVSWINDDPGSGAIFIVDDDQVTVSGDVDPELSFNVGSQAAATTCDGTFSGNGGTLPLGALTTASVASSDASSVPHVCTRVTTNSTGGATVSVRSLNAALASLSTPADEISSSTATLVAGTEGYGMCVGSSGIDTGTDATTPTGATPVRSAPFNSTCTATDHNVGGLTTSLQSLFTLAASSQNAFARVYLKAAISPGTPAHDDYTDVLTFIVSAEY